MRRHRSSGRSPDLLGCHSVLSPASTKSLCSTGSSNDPGGISGWDLTPTWCRMASHVALEELRPWNEACGMRTLGALGNNGCVPIWCLPALCAEGSSEGCSLERCTYNCLPCNQMGQSRPFGVFSWLCPMRFVDVTNIPLANPESLQ